MKKTEVDLFLRDAGLMNDYVACSAAVSIVTEYELVTRVAKKREFEHGIVTFVSPDRPHIALPDLVSASLGLTNFKL